METLPQTVTDVHRLESAVKARLYAMSTMRQLRQMAVIQRYHRMLSETMDNDIARVTTFDKWLRKHAR